MVGDGVVHQLRVRLHVHLAEDARTVGGHRVGRKEELVGDLAHRLAGGDHPHHLVLAVGKRLVQRLAAVILELQRQLLAQRGGDVAAAAGDLADGAHQLLGRAFLGEVARRPRLEGAHGIAVLGVHGEDQYRPAGVALAQLLDQLQAVLARHVVVEHRHFPWHAPGKVDHLLAVAGLAHHGQVGFHCQHLPQSLADYGMVVRADHFHGGCLYSLFYALFLIGMTTATRVPCPGAPVMLTSPPNSRARSWIASSTGDLRPFKSLSAIPTPLSCTWSRTSVSLTSSSMSTRVAREGRATLGRISWKMRNALVETSMSSLPVSGGSLTRQRMPVRFWKSFPCQPIAATTPMSSSISGRSPVAILRTVCTVESISFDIDSVFSRSCGSCRRFCSQPTSISMPVSTCPSSSWISRAMCALSSSLTEIK